MYILFLIFFSLLHLQYITATETVTESNTQELNTTPDASEPQKLYVFNYKDIPITDIINEFAAKKNINIILPAPQSPQAITAKLTYAIAHKITLDQGWKELNKIIELLGYSWIINNNIYTLTKISPDIKREPLSVYINPHLSLIPDSGMVIQGIFYLSNLKLRDDTTKTALESILKSMLSSIADIKRDEKTNALILTDKANNIKSAMTVIQELDLEGIPDALEIVPLYYTEAPFVEEIFKSKLLPQQPTPTAVQGVKQASYFPQNTKIIALPRTNNIVIMGSVKAIRVVKDFLVKYIDKPLESGESILHIFDLQYLNAEDFADILQSLVSKSNTGQAQTQTVGIRRDFQDVIIVAEKSTLTSSRIKTNVAGQITPTEAPGPSQGGEAPSGQTQGIEQAGNRLLIAARKEDWVRIEKIIKDLDKPLPQVAIEVLVVDVTLRDNTILGNQMRNKSGFNDSSPTENLNFQTAMLDNPVLRQPIDTGIVDPNTGQDITDFPANALMANLLQPFTDSNSTIAQDAGVGSVVITFNDNQGTWDILQMLKARANTELIATPYIITTDNRQASLTISQQRLVDGEAVSQGAAIKVQKQNVIASTSIDILPRISEESNSVNLNIIINVNQFLPENNNRSTRLIQTNANVGNKEALALGGLIRLSDTTEDREVPLLCKIPIIGWFFKRKANNKEKNNLMVFITPTIIYPRNYKTQQDNKIFYNEFTQTKLCLAEHDIAEGSTLDSLRDPITRWFFKPDPDYGHRVIENYVAKNFLYENDAENSACCPPDIRPAFGPPAVFASNEPTSYEKQSEALKTMIMHEDNPLASHKPAIS